MAEELVFKVSKLKDHTSFVVPKNYRSSDLEAYCASKTGDVIWCYFSSELGIFLKNMNTRATERFLTIEGVEYLDIDLNTSDGSYILLYKKEGNFFLRYFKDFEYKTIPLELNCDKAFVHYSELYLKSMIVLIDKDSKNLIEYNSKDDFEYPINLSDSTYPKQILTQVGISEETGHLAFDFVVSDNSLLWDLDLYPKFQDLEYREYPLKLSEFKHVVKNKEV